MDVERVGGEHKAGQIIAGRCRGRTVSGGAGGGDVVEQRQHLGDLGGVLGTLRWPMMTPSPCTSAENSFTFTSRSSSQAPLSTLPSSATMVRAAASPTASRPAVTWANSYLPTAASA